MKKHGRNILVTSGLFILLMIVIAINVILFITGPALRYEDKIASQETVITEKYKVDELHRHVFAYVMYSGSDGNEVYWFNENGELMTKREMSKIQSDEAAAQALADHGLDQTTVTLGYGYDNPVYVISNEQGEVFYDIDTMKEVFYRQKG